MAIQMEAEDHAKTSSFRNSLASRAYRKTIESKMMQGDIRGAIATEISDVKKHTGRKYNSALKEMLEYGIDNGLIPDKK